MAIKIYEVAITSQKDGSLKIKRFPIDEGMYKAIKSLPTFEEQVKWFTEEYRSYKQEENFQKHHPVDSLDIEDPDLGKAHQIQDDSLTPVQSFIKQERIELLSEAISHLNARQKKVIIAIYYKGKPQTEVAKELGMTDQAMSMFVSYALAKLRSELEGKI